MTKVTIFTATYNRAHLLQRLYRSLEAQTVKNFEWVLVDDGSTDSTDSVIAEIARTATFKFVPLNQFNAGKHVAINRGVSAASGAWFYIVDSDDWLPPEAIAKALPHLASIKEVQSFGGVCGLKADESGAKIGGEENWKTIDCSSLEFRYKHHGKGDMAEIYKTAVLREFPFPQYPNEKFCPEALVWNRIARRYKLRYFYERIYFCEYQGDGLSANITRLRRQSVCATTRYYAELMLMPVPWMVKMKAAANLVRFSMTAEGLRKFYGTLLDGFKTLLRPLQRLFARWMNRKYELELPSVKLPIVVDKEETLRYMLENKCSIARFGDGEFRLIFQSGDGISFQKQDRRLAQRLRDILKSHDHEGRVIVAIPNIFGSLAQYTDEATHFFRIFLLRERAKIYPFINLDSRYYDALISRCYMDFRDKSKAADFFSSFCALWHNRDIVIFEGEWTRFGVGNDLLSEAKSIRRVLCPSKSAFDCYDKILTAAQLFPKNCVFLLALGPTATVLAYDLGMLGFQAIDIGHLDIEYEWFKRGAKKKVPIDNKFVGEAGGLLKESDMPDISAYLNQVTLRIERPIK